MQHNWIRSFHYTAKYQSIVKAASVLNVAPSAISKQIIQLEKYYGVQLFERSANKIHLTHTGTSLNKETQKYFEGERSIKNLLEQVNNRGNKTVNIGLENIDSMKPMLLNLKSNFPNVLFRLYNEDHLTLEHMFSSDKLDILISYERHDQKQDFRGFAKSHFIQSEHIKLIAPKALYQQLSNNPRFGDVLGQYPFVVHTRESLTRSIFDDLCAHMDLCAHIAFEVSTRNGVLDMVNLGAGVGMVIGDIGDIYKNVFEIPFVASDDIKSIMNVKTWLYYHESVDKSYITHDIFDSIKKGFHCDQGKCKKSA